MEKVKDSFKKHPDPVFGGPEMGTMFDAFVRERDGKLRMDVSWRPQKALAVSFSEDGLHWSEPQITLRNDPESSWEHNLNRHCVIPAPDGKGYWMWYTGQASGHSWIGVAKSEDGIHFERFRKDPILSPETDFEGESVMNPFVMYEDGKFKMWYAAGETYEPNVICYAESDDGVNWKKYEGNPIFCCNPEKEYEQNRIGACDVLRDEKGYLMFYIGYRDINTACVCAARSENGITDWKRAKENPLVTPTPGTWDEDSCYKPTVVRTADGTYRLWYNGRCKAPEYIGYAEGKIE